MSKQVIPIGATANDGTGIGARTAFDYINQNFTEVYKEVIVIACSDELTALVAGVAKVTFRMPYALQLIGVKASVSEAATGSAIQVDINEAGVSIFSTPLTIDATEETSDTAATAAVISDTGLANDAEITIDIDQIGSTTAGKGLKVYLLGNKV